MERNERQNQGILPTVDPPSSRRTVMKRSDIIIGLGEAEQGYSVEDLPRPTQLEDSDEKVGYYNRTGTDITYLIQA